MRSFCLNFVTHGPMGTERFAFDPDIDEFGDYNHMAIQTLNSLDDSSQQMTLFLPLGPINMFSNQQTCFQ